MLTQKEQVAGIDFISRHNSPNPCTDTTCPWCVLWDISTTEDFCAMLPMVAGMLTEVIQ